MNFKEWLISEEIFPNKTATVYHRTCQNCNEEDSVKSVSGILTSDFKAGTGKGCFYGCGLYTTFAIESQFSDYMYKYGKAVVKFVATDLDKYLIFQLSVAKQIHGKDYKISSQLKKLGLLNKVNEIKLKEYDERQEKEKYSATFAKEFYDQNDWIVNSVKGIIYYGANDGYCLLKYKPVQDGAITMLGYAVAEHNDMKKMEELKNNIGWIKSVGALGTPIKNVYNAPNKIKGKFAFVYNNIITKKLLISKNLEKTAKELELDINKLSDENFYNLFKKATDKNKMAEVIVKYKIELTDKNVHNFLDAATDKDKMAKTIINKLLKFTHDSVLTLLNYADNIDKIAELIIEKKPELSYISVFYLLDRTTDKDKIAELIIENKPELSDEDISFLLKYAAKKDKIATLLGTDNISKLSDKQVYNLFDNDYVTDKDKLAQIISQYHTKKTPKIQELINKYSSGFFKRILNLGKKVISTGSFT